MGSAGDAGVGLAKIWYAIDKIAAAPAIVTTPAAAGYTELATGGNWNFTKAIPGDLAEGVGYYLHVLAEDSSGNRTPMAVSTRFDIDQAAPSLDSAAPSTQYATSSVTLAGTASDTNGLSSVTATRYNGTTTVAQAVVGSGSWSIAVDPAVIGEGVFTYAITATDVAGRTTTIEKIVTVDMTPPAVSVSNVSPLVGSNTVNGIVSFTASAIDANGLTGVKWSILPATDAAPTYTTAANTFAAPPYTSSINTTTLSDNISYKLWIAAKDKAGNENVASFTLQVNQASDKPSFTLTNMNAAYDTLAEAAGNLQETGAKVTGTIIDDDGVNGATLKISVDGLTSVDVSTKTATGSGYSFEHNLSALAEGVHYLTLTASDINTVTAAPVMVYFTLDKFLPNVGVNLPVAASSQKVDFTIQGYANDTNGLMTWDHDGNAGTDEIPYVEVDTGLGLNKHPVTAGTWSLPITLPGNGSLGDGSKIIYIRATDRFQKTNDISFTYTEDETAPDPSINLPAPGAWYRGTTLNASGTVVEDNGLTALEWALDASTSWTPITVSTSWTANVPISGESEGTHNLKIRATDRAGNVVTESYPFGIDQTDPTTSVSAPSGATTVFTIGGTALDGNAVRSVVVTQIKDGVPASQVEAYRLDSIQTLGTPTEHEWTTGDLPIGGVSTGTYTYTVTVTDLAGHSRTYADAATVAIDLTPPNTFITDPSTNPASLFGNSYEIRGTASDTGPSGLARVDYRVWNNQTATWSIWNSSSGTATWSKLFTLTGGSGLGEGSFILEAKAYDGSDNVDPSPAVLNFYIDQSLPAVSVFNGVGTFSTINGSLYTASGFGLTMTAADTNALASYTLRQKRGTSGEWKDIATDAILSGTSQTWTVTNLPRNPASPTIAVTDLTDGLYTYSLTVKDAATRVSETYTWTVTFDAADPSVAILTPGANEIVSSASITATGTATDGEGSGVEFVYYTLDGSVPTAATAGTSVLSGTSNWNGTINLGDEGGKILKVRSKDFYGNYSSEGTVIFNLDLTPPTLTEAAVGAGTQRRSGDFSLYGVAYDTNGLKTWDHDGDDANDDGFTDASGNTLTATAKVEYITVNVDTATTNVRVYANGEPGDPDSGDGFAFWIFQYTVPLDGSKDGDHTFTITATDVVNKPTTLTRLVTVDSTKPTIAVDGLMSGFISGTANAGTFVTGRGYVITSVGDTVWTAAGAVLGTVGEAFTATSAGSGSGTASYNLVNGSIGLRFSGNDNGVGIEKSDANYLAYYTVVVNGTTPVQNAAAIAGWTQITSASSNFNISYDTLAASLGLAGSEEMDIWIGIRDAVTVAPNFHAVKFDLSVDQTSDTPTITLDNLNALAATNSVNSLGQSPSILVTISDDDLVNVASLRYRIDANNDGVYDATFDLWNGLPNGLPDGDKTDKWENENTWYDFGTALTSSKLVQSAKILLENFPQGMFGIQIEAKDLMGTVYSTATVPNVKFAVDYGPPAITVGAPLSGIFTGNSIAYDITSVDALGVEEIKYSFDNGATYTTLFSGPAAANVSRSGNIDISARDSGEYTLQVVATDIGGFAATQQIPITIDKAPPTVDILSPAAGVTLNGATYVVRGEAFDNRLVGAVFLWHGLVTADDPVLPARTAPDTYTPGGYTMLSDKSVWNTTIDTTAQILTAADAYRIRVVAIDAIGNVGTPEEILVKVDQEKDRPIISFSNLTIGDPTNRLGSGGRIVGLAEDDDLVRLADIDSATLGNQPGLQIILDTDQDGLLTDETWQYVSNVQSSNAPFVSWYHDVSALPQGLMKAKVRAIDTQVPNAFSATEFDVTEFVDNRLGSGTLTASYNWTESPVLSFYIDFGPPTLTNVLPTSSSRFNLNSVTVSGGASDALGLKKISIWVDKDNDNLVDSTGGEWTNSDADGIVDAGEWTDTNSDGWVDANELYIKLGGANETFDLQTGSASYTFSHTINSLTDGTKLIQVKAYDLGYAETVRDLSITIDTTLPTSTIAFPADTSTINAGSFVIGTAYVIVSSGNTAFDSIGASAGFVPGTVFIATGVGTGTGTASSLPVMNGSFNLIGTADDPGGIISSVEYVVVPYTSVADLTDSGSEAWNLLAGQTNNWSVSLDTTALTDKAHYILKVRSKDWANNYSLTTNRIIRIDQSTDRPRIQVTSIIEGWTFVQNILPGDKVITGTIQDDDKVSGSSIQRRIYAADGTTVLDDWANVTTQPADGTYVIWSTVIGRIDGTYQIRLRAYDTVTLAYTGFGYDDRFSEYLTDNGGVPDGDENNGVSFAIDTANPGIEVEAPAQNYFSNEDITFKGTASDGSGIKTLTVGYRLQGVLNYTPLTVTGTLDWSASLAVAGIADGVYDWRVTATDNFDKSSIVDRIFTLDRTRPELSISNPGTDAIVNGSLYIDGSATDKWKGIDLNLDGDYLDTDESVADGFQITSVRVWMGKWTVGETVEPVPPALTSFHTKADTDNLIHDAANWKELNGTNSWNYRINTTVPTISGTHSIFVAAFDNSGNVSTISKRRIYIDQATNLPSISLTTLLPGYDSGTIAELPDATTTTFSDDALSDSAVVAGWYVRFRNTGIIRKVTAFSGSQITFSPKLTTKPSGDFDLFPNLLGLPSAAEGEVWDDDGVNATAIKIAVDANGDGDFDDGGDEDFTTMVEPAPTVSGGKVIFSYNIGGLYDQGLSVYRLKVQASDTGEPYGVDPVTRTTNEYVFVRDDSAPASATLTLFGNGVETRNDGIVGSNFRNNFHLEGDATDVVGVANVEVAIGTADNFTLPAVPWDFADAVVTNRDAASATWSFTNENVGANEGPIVVRVRVTDMVGRQTTESFTFNVDKTGPVSAFESPAVASLANGSLYISGSAQDTYRISQVYLWIEDSANPTPTLPTSSASNGWIPATGTGAWNHRFDTTDLINGAKTVHVVSIDNAGNVGDGQTLAVTFDQGINRPILTVPGLGSSTAIGTMGVSEKTNFTDTALIGNLDVKIGWAITLPDGTEKTVSAFNSGTGLVSWTGDLASAFPVGSSYTLAAPWYTITTHLDDVLTVSALSDANRGSTPAPVAGSVALIEVSAGVNVTYLVSAFDGATGKLTLVSAPAGVTSGSTRVKVLPKTLLGLGASLSGTVTDDDGVNTGTIRISIDLNNDGDYEDTVDGLTEAYQNVASVSGAGNAVSFSQSLATLLQGTTVYKIRITASDKGETIILIPAVTETTEYLVAKDDAVPNDSALESFANGFYGASLAVPAKETNITGSYIANGRAITLTGTASDEVGVSAVDISLNGGTIWLPASGTTIWSWTHTFTALVDGANVPILVRTTDYWGRTAITQFSFKADSAPPSATFPAFGRKLNGVETLQGTANDLNSGVHAVYINKMVSDGVPATFMAFDPADPTANGWTTAGVNGTTSWNSSLDTITISNTNVDKNVRIGVTAVDEAGNFFSFERLETINQDSDRPVISFSNIGMTSSALVNRFDANPKIIGSSLDDDGVDMTKVLVSLDGSAYVLVTNPPTANGNAGTTVTWSHELTDIISTVPADATATGLMDAALFGKRQITAGSWQIVFTISGSTILRDVATFDSDTGVLTYASTGTAPSVSDAYTLRLKEGLHTVSVRVGDVGSGVDSVRTSSYHWEQSDGNATAGWDNDPTDFTYDTGAPVIAFTNLLMSDRYSGTYGAGKTWNLTDENLMSAVVLNNDWTLSGTALDGSLASVTVQVDSGTVSGNIATGSTWTYNLNWLSSPPDGFLQGSHMVKVTATDTFGKSTVKTLPVIFDSVEPVNTLSSPASTALVFNSSVNGIVYMNGSLGEASVVGIDVGLAGRASYYATYTTPTAVANWTYNFNSGTMLTDPGAPDFKRTYAMIAGDTNDDGIKDAGETWVGDNGDGGGTANNGIEDGTEIFAYISNIRITATDTAGNVTRQTYTFTIDNSTDRPAASFTLPTDGSYRSGDVLISGLSSDDNQADDGVYNVWVQLDVNGDGLFTGSWTFPGGATAGAGNDPYENETLWYKVPASQLINGAAWSLSINGNGTLESATAPSKTPILTPVTIAAGQLYASATGFSGMIKMRAVAVDNHGTVGVPTTARTIFLDESYPSVAGIFINGTAHTPGASKLVNAIVRLSTLFSDDQTLGISRLEVKYNTTAFAPIPANALAGPYDWNGDGINETYALKKAASTAINGTSSGTTVTSLTATALDGLTLLPLMILHTGSGSRVITGFVDGTGSGTVSWTGELTLAATEPFIVVQPFELDTNSATAIGGTVYQDNEGELNVIFRVTDETNQASQTTVELAVDNKRPGGVFNHNDLLTYIGADRASGLYSFSGNNGTANLLVGNISDAGIINGVRQVGVYFVKDMNSDDLYDAGDKFWSPRLNQTGTAIGATVSMYATGSSSATFVPYPVDGDYIIMVNNRTENLIYDTDPENDFGDDDGFQESLLAKTGYGYDEWKVYFDTIKLPDGPMWIFSIYEDNAGNRSFQRIRAQITNYPPSMSAISVNASAATGDPWQFKVAKAADVPFVLTASDPGSSEVRDNGWSLVVDGEYGNDNAGQGTTQTAATTGTYTVTSTSPSFSGTALVDLDDAKFKDGFWYRFRATATDLDGNIATREFYTRTMTADETGPVISVNPINQTSVSMWTNKEPSKETPLSLDVPSAKVDTSNNRITLALPSWMKNGSEVMFAGTSIPEGFSTNTLYYIGNISVGPFFQLYTDAGLTSVVDIAGTPTGTYRLVSGGHVESLLDDYSGFDADVSGAIRLSGTVFDLTDVLSLTISINGEAAETITLDQNTRTGSALIGWTYSWSYIWDTSSVKVSGNSVVADDDVSISLVANDTYSNPTTNASVTADVVPYLLYITDTSGLTTDVLRGATGKYSISTHLTNTLTALGYNLGSATQAPVARVSPTTDYASGYVGGGGGTATSDGTYPLNRISISKNWSKSGYLTVLVNDIPSGNNLDSNPNAAKTTNLQNDEATSDPRTRQWNDDRYLWVWDTTQLNLTTITGSAQPSGTYYNPNMVMNGDKPEFAFNDDNYGRTIYSTDDDAATRRTGYRLMRQAGYATAKVSGVLQRFIVTFFDSTWTTSGDNTGRLEVTGFANQDVDGEGEVYGPSIGTDGGSKWMVLQGIDYYNDTDATFGSYRISNRFPNPKIIAETSNPDGGANIYVAYHDASPYSNGTVDEPYRFKNLNFASFRMTGPEAGNLNIPNDGNRRSTDVQPIKGTADGHSSQYFDMAKVGGTGGVAIAYYDAADAHLKLAYSEKAYNSTGVVDTENKTNKDESTTYQTTQVVLTSGTRTNYQSTREATTVALGSAERGVYGGHEVTQVVFAVPGWNGGARRTNLNGDYFTIYDGTTPWDVFFDSSAGQTLDNPGPNGAGGDWIRVNISVASTNADFGTALNTMIRANGAFNMTATNTTATQYITVTAPGASSNMVGGTFVSSGSGTAITYSQGGSPKYFTIADGGTQYDVFFDATAGQALANPGSSAQSIRVNISVATVATPSAANFGTRLNLAVDAVAAFNQTATQTGASQVITVTAVGDALDAQPGTFYDGVAGGTITVTTQGASKFFTLYDGTVPYTVWFYVDAGDVTPRDAINDIMVDISAATIPTANAANFGTALNNAVRAYQSSAGPFSATTVQTGATQVITRALPGSSWAASAGSMATAPAVGTVTTPTTGTTKPNWQIVSIDTTPNAGMYCSILSDGTYVYIAYYDFDAADLKLARVTWNGIGTINTLTDVSIVSIDRYLSAGSWTKLFFVQNSMLNGGVTTQQPAIAYYSDSYNGTKKPIRLALPQFDTTGSLLHGTTSNGEDEDYSGNWEIMTIPAESTPKGGAETFNRVQAGSYATNTLPVLGWLGDKLEYGKLMPNN